MKRSAISIFLLGVFITSVGLSPPSRDVRAAAYYREGLAYEADGRLELAEQRFKAAVKFDPDMADAYLALGAAYLKMERLNLAERNTLQAISLLPRTAVRNSGYRGSLSMAYNNLGVIEVKRSTEAWIKGDKSAAAAHWEQARAFYLTALDVDKDNLHAQQNLQQSLSLSD